MDEEMSRRIRQVLQDAVDRQRPPTDTEAAKQQMLVSTLRLAGHTVNLSPGIPAAPYGEARPPDGATPSDQPSLGGNPNVRDGIDWVDDPTRPADYGKPQLLPYVVTDPAMQPAAAALLHSQRMKTLQPYRVSPAAAMGEGTQNLATEAEPDGSSNGAEIAPGDSEDLSTPVADPITADSLLNDAPPAWSMTVDGDSADFPDPSAPDASDLDASGAELSFSFPSTAGGDGGDDGGDSQPSGGEGASGDGQTPVGQPPIVVQPTASLTERLATAAAEKASSLAQTTVDAAVSDLRHEIYVSRAAWNALFPR